MVTRKQNISDNIRILYLLLILTITGITCAPVYAAIVIATVDRNPVNLDESFQLTLTVKGSSNGNPDFDILKNNFDILSRNQSNNIQIINGEMSRQSLWVVTLMAKKTGNVIIPAIRVGKDSSQAIKMAITQPSGTEQSNNDIFLEVSTNLKESYIQAQLIYTVRLYTSVSLGSASLSEAKTSGIESIIEKLGEDREFQTQRNGKPYRVIERRYAIFPQQSGTLKLEPILFNGQLIQSRSRFSNNPFLQSTRSKRLRSEPLTINIKPAPNTQNKQPWLPARNIQLIESWQQDPPQFKTGEAITRTLTLLADGLLAEQLPEILISMPASLKHYSDQAVVKDIKKSTGIIATRQQKVAIIPSQAGQYTLPEIKLDWWNTQTQRNETLSIPPRTIQVMTADATTSQDAPIQNSSIKTGSSQNSAVGVDVPNEEENEFNLVQQKNYWTWISLVLAIGWLGTFLIMRSQKKALRHYDNLKPQAQIENTLSAKAATTKLKQACLSNDPAASKDAILTWANIYFTDEAVTSLANLSDRTNETVSAELEKLNQALYSQTENTWQGQDLWESIQIYAQSTIKKHKKNKQILLSPLYP